MIKDSRTISKMYFLQIKKLVKKHKEGVTTRILCQQSKIGICKLPYNLSPSIAI
jgi:hypothetical protein